MGGYDVYMTRAPSGASISLGGSSASSSPASNNTSAAPSGSADGRTSSKAQVGRRRLAQLVVKGNEDYLDGFRRVTARWACAHSAAYSWSMAGIPQTVDVARYRALVAGHDIVDILADAAHLLKS